MEDGNRPKIGLALSGASGRAITHIGVLEVLREQNIPIDIITACSSGTIVASSYACGTMEELKHAWIRMKKKLLFSMVGLDQSGTGFLNIDKFADWINKFTLRKNFEGVSPRLGFVCADILTGEPVLLNLGDLAKACRASCSVPGLFEPMRWGNRLLVDGGLFSIIPTVQARQMGADIVVAVDIASTRYMFSQRFMRVRKGYNFLRRSWPVKIYAKIHSAVDRLFSKSIDFIYHNQSDLLEERTLTEPSMMAILGKALDISVAQSEKFHGRITGFDHLILPNVKHLGKADFDSAKNMYIEGRRAALAAIPQIKKLIAKREREPILL